jgi:hypothetical protein
MESNCTGQEIIPPERWGEVTRLTLSPETNKNKQNV